jgi:hypothetical protein
VLIGVVAILPSPLTTALLNTLARTLKSVATASCLILPSGSTTDEFVAVVEVPLVLVSEITGRSEILARG